MNTLSKRQYHEILIALQELNITDNTELLNQTEIDKLCEILTLEHPTKDRISILIKDHKVTQLFSNIKGLFNPKYLVIDYDLNFGPDEEPPTMVTLHDGTKRKGIISVTDIQHITNLPLAPDKLLDCA